MIEFTQFLRPRGIPVPICIALDEVVETKAAMLRDRGFVFHTEVLTTGQVSLTIFDTSTEEDVHSKLVWNGPAVPVAVREMIMEYQPNGD